MSFKKKIDKILDTNTLGINSINGLEKEIGASTGAVNKFYNNDRDPGKATVKKIKNKFNIDDISWRNGDFDLSPKGHTKDAFDRAIDAELKKSMLDQLYKDLDNQARHLDKALDLVARLLPPNPGQGVERVTAKDR